MAQENLQPTLDLRRGHVLLMMEKDGSDGAGQDVLNDTPLAQAAGYAGSARNFRRLVAEAKKTWRRSPSRAAAGGLDTG
ncbi:MAG: hypothetical protein K0R62_7086 [Nonomuraea muscovyensis]|nr:hypothetical protein [Nonomuraea muscovyensis]